MRRIRLYWNNICVLHKGELAFLDRIRKELAPEGIDLEVTPFGLGYEYHLSDYLRREDAVLPDLIVSADLEVFEDERIFSRFSDRLYPAAEWVPLKSSEDVRKIYRSRYLLPYLAIPLVFYSPKADFPKELSLRQVAEESYDIAFGGINNSAGKSVVKTLWSGYGKAAADSIFRNALVTGMPVESFNAARRGVKPLALVPSLFALNDPSGSAFIPSDGAVAVPSYIAALDSAAEDDLKKVVSKLEEPDVLSFYAEKGNLVTAMEGSPENSWFTSQGSLFQLPTSSWLNEMRSEDFYRFYSEHIPLADRHY